MGKNRKKAEGKVYMSAIDRVYTDNIESPNETVNPKGMVSYGENNSYPNYLYSLYENVATLQSVINGTYDFVCGDGIKCPDAVNAKGETVEDVVKQTVMSYLIFGGFAVNITRDAFGRVQSVYCLDFRKVRTNKEKSEFYYSDSWGKYTAKASVYPPYRRDGDEKSSILYVSRSYHRVYPLPLWSACVKSCETEKKISDFHLNAISNGFSGNFIINLLNGIPTDEQIAECERLFMDKYCSESNSGRFVLNFAPDKDHAATIEKIPTDDFDKKYEALSKRTRQEIFTAFRANPNLFGISTENIGFSKEEYAQAAKLFVRTVCKPIQDTIIKAFREIFGATIEITPLNIFNEE